MKIMEFFNKSSSRRGDSSPRGGKEEELTLQEVEVHWRHEHWSLACGELQQIFEYGGEYYQVRITTMLGNLQDLFNLAEAFATSIRQDVEHIVGHLHNGEMSVVLQIHGRQGVATVEPYRK